MELIFPIDAKIQKPVAEVFDAVYDPRKLKGYFTTAQASAPLEAGTEVTWEFADFPGAFTVRVKESKRNERIVFTWEANDGSGKGAGYDTRVEMTFTAVDPDTTRVHIVETGWRDSPGALKAAVGNSQGWMHFACCLKAYVEYGINLRKGFI